MCQLSVDGCSLEIQGGWVIGPVQFEIGSRKVHFEVWNREVETFALVAKMNTGLVLLALVVHFNWTLQHMKNAFLHGDFRRVVY